MHANDSLETAETAAALQHTISRVCWRHRLFGLKVYSAETAVARGAGSGNTHPHCIAAKSPPAWRSLHQLGDLAALCKLVERAFVVDCVVDIALPFGEHPDEDLAVCLAVVAHSLRPRAGASPSASSGWASAVCHALERSANHAANESRSQYSSWSRSHPSSKWPQ